MTAFEYRIDYTITRRGPEDRDFIEIGFGSTYAHPNVNDAAGDVEAFIQNRQWETTGDMPEPETVNKEGAGS